jgi:hypothetical protein
VSEVSQHESDISLHFYPLVFYALAFATHHTIPPAPTSTKIFILIEQAATLPRYERFGSKYWHWVPWDISPKDLSTIIAIYVPTPPASDSRSKKKAILSNLDPGRCSFAFTFSVLILASILFSWCFGRIRHLQELDWRYICSLASLDWVGTGSRVG